MKCNEYINVTDVKHVEARLCTENENLICVREYDKPVTIRDIAIDFQEKCPYVCCCEELGYFARAFIYVDGARNGCINFYEDGTMTYAPEEILIEWEED